MYLRLKDYDRRIQRANLLQIINSDDSLRLSAELAAQEEANSYLLYKYDTSREFTDTLPFTWSATYAGNARVYIDTYSTYNAATTYTIGSYTTYNGRSYYNSTNASVTGAFDASKWNDLGPVDAMYFVTPPAAYFDFAAIYKRDDLVFYKGRKYKAILPSSPIDHITYLNAQQQNNLPPINIFPDDPTYGAKYWLDQGTYAITGIKPTDTTKWTAGDNRSQKLVEVITDIAIYQLHCRISPQNVPESRRLLYMGSDEQTVVSGNGAKYPTSSALGWLQAAATGNINANLPLFHIPSRNRVRWGGNTRTNNTY
jgi:hypothetical protein